MIAHFRLGVLGIAALAIGLAARAQETELPAMSSPPPAAAPRAPAIAPAAPEWTSPTGYGLSFRWLGWSVKAPGANSPAAAGPTLEILPADKTPQLCTIKERRANPQPNVTQAQLSAATTPRTDAFVAAYIKNDPMGGSTVKSAAYSMVGDVAVLRIALETKDQTKPIIARETAYFAVLSEAATTHVLVECYIGAATPKDKRDEAGRILTTLAVQGKPFAPPALAASPAGPAKTQ